MAFKDWFDYSSENTVYLVNPVHGGKESCAQCSGYIEEGSKFNTLLILNERRYLCENCVAKRDNV